MITTKRTGYTTAGRPSIPLAELALIRADAKLRNLAELQAAGSEFCKLFDAWIQRQPERVALTGAGVWGPEYQRLQDLLNGGGK